MKCKAYHFDVLIHDYYFIYHTLQLVTLQHWTVWSTRVNFARTKSRSSLDISEVDCHFMI